MPTIATSLAALAIDESFTFEWSVTATFTVTRAGEKSWLCEQEDFTMSFFFDSWQELLRSIETTFLLDEDDE